MAYASGPTRIRGNARVPWTRPQKLTPKSQPSSSGTASRIVDVTATPALLNTAPSGAGSHARTSSANRTTSAASLTSSTRRSTAPDSDAAVFCSPDPSTSAIATGEPSRESRYASARPIPEAAPVTTTGRPAILGRCRGIGTGPCVRGDQVEQRRPHPDRQVVAKTGARLQAGTGDRPYRRGGAARVDHPVPVPVYHQRRYGDRLEHRGPVAG